MSAERTGAERKGAEGTGADGARAERAGDSGRAPARAGDGGGATAEATGLEEALGRAVGRRSESRHVPDPVNVPMIRHWCDALDDRNPVYLDPDAAARSVHGRLVAPPAMLDAWLMPGLAPRTTDPTSSPIYEVLNALDAAGFTSVVATNAEHEYDRYLVPGDTLESEHRVRDVSAEKQTALGRGHFVTTETEVRDASGARVGRAMMRMLKFAPGTGRIATGAGGDAAAPAPPVPRPRPAISDDTRFFWEGIERGELRIQRCTACDVLHHPPVVRCPRCGSYDLGFAVASGRGHVYSVVEVCHPRVPGFDYPLQVALVELEEGTRIVANLCAVEPERVEIGMPVEAFFDRVDPELVLPAFRPRRPTRAETSPAFDSVRAGHRLAPCPVPLTRTLIIAGAIASRDYQDVHHDHEIARRRGSADIFMNILTTGGLCARYATDWAGPDARLRRMALRLGAPNYPGDTMTLTGEVESAERRAGVGVVALALRGANRLGDHVNGRIELVLPDAPAGAGARR